MKIFYDHQIFSLQKWGGISRYFAELEIHILILSVHTPIIGIFLTDNMYIRYGYNLIPRFLNRVKYKIQFIINSIYSIFYLIFSKFDLLHPTYFSTFFLPFLFGRPFVLTIHDMTHEKFKDEFKNAQLLISNKKKLAQKANRVIAISEHSKRDIIDILGVDSNKIDVIYHGNSLEISQSVKVQNLPKEYILFVGKRGGYKNFDLFIKAVKEIDVMVVCIGGGDFTKKELILLNTINMQNKIMQLSLSDGEMVYAYQHASLFVFPSRYEGFGIPLLEAFACSCPVVCSNTSSLPEVAGNAAKYFDPYDMTSIRTAVMEVLSSGQDQERLVKLGTERLKDFSWERVANQTVETYKKAIRDK